MDFHILYAILLIFVSIYYVLLCGGSQLGFLFAVIFVPFEIEMGNSPEMMLDKKAVLSQR